MNKKSKIQVEVKVSEERERDKEASLKNALPSFWTSTSHRSPEYGFAHRNYHIRSAIVGAISQAALCSFSVHAAVLGGDAREPDRCVTLCRSNCCFLKTRYSTFFISSVFLFSSLFIFSLTLFVHRTQRGWFLIYSSFWVLRWFLCFNGVVVCFSKSHVWWFNTWTSDTQQVTPKRSNQILPSDIDDLWLRC